MDFVLIGIVSLIIVVLGTLVFSSVATNVVHLTRYLSYMVKQAVTLSKCAWWSLCMATYSRLSMARPTPIPIDIALQGALSKRVSVLTPIDLHCWYFHRGRCYGKCCERLLGLNIQAVHEQARTLLWSNAGGHCDHGH